MEADSSVRTKLEANRRGMEMLSGGPEFLSQSLPSPSNASGADGNSPAVSKLRALMREVGVREKHGGCECWRGHVRGWSLGTGERREP